MKDDDDMTLFSVGTTVSIGEDIPGKVIGIWITGGRRILYQVCWWNGRSREEKWLEEFEVVVKGHSSRTTEIGFH